MMDTLLMTLVYRLFETPLWVWAAAAFGAVLCLRARWRLDRACEAAAGAPARPGLTGGDAAVEMLRNAGVYGVRVEVARSEVLGAGYDPSVRVVRLGRSVYEGSSLAAVGLAAHEVGHALQHAGGDAPQPLELRDAVGFGVRLGGGTAALLIAVGIGLELRSLVGIGALVLMASACMPLALVPLERDAARRGRRVLAMSALVDSRDERIVGPVVEAAGCRELSALVPRFRRPRWQSRAVRTRRTLPAIGE